MVHEKHAHVYATLSVLQATFSSCNKQPSTLIGNWPVPVKYHDLLDWSGPLVEMICLILFCFYHHHGASCTTHTTDDTMWIYLQTERKDKKHSLR